MTDLSTGTVTPSIQRWSHLSHTLVSENALNIVSAALEILSKTQCVEFSLRELARRAGVSHNAPLQALYR
jgi:hypothetical protein